MSSPSPPPPHPPHPTRAIKLATTQLEPVFFDRGATIQKTLSIIQEAAANGAHLLAFPECWIPGYPGFIWAYNFAQQRQFVKKLYDNALSVSSPEFAQIQSAVKEAKIYVMLGFIERVGGSMYMAQTLLSPAGEILLHRQKLKPTHMERTLFGDGSGGSVYNVVETDVGKVGGSMCWEHLQPLLRQNAMQLGEEVHVASWPTMMEEVAPWSFSIRASALASQYYAMETATFVLCATQCYTERSRDVYVLPEDGETTIQESASFRPQPGAGCAAIYAPDGRKLTEDKPSDWEGILYAEVDLGECVLGKNTTDPAGHYLRSDVLELVVHEKRRSGTKL